MPFDLNRGVQIRKHPSGMEIGMYLGVPGKDGKLVGYEPNVYYDVHGKPVADALAAEAGFDLELNAIAAEEYSLEKELETELQTAMEKKKAQLLRKRNPPAEVPEVTLPSVGESEAA